MSDNDIKILIRNRRIELGLTMKDVAQAVGVSEGTVSRWESGNISNMRRDRIFALARVLQISVDDLMDWNGETPPPLPSPSATQSDNKEVGENTISFIGRNGERVVKTYTPEQMETIRRLLDAIPSESSDF